MLKRHRQNAQVSKRVHLSPGHWATFLITSGLLLIIYTTLFPFDFVAKNDVTRCNIVNQLDKRLLKPGLGDFLRNVLLFIPVSFGLAASCQPKNKQYLFVLLVILGAGLSATVEILQTLFLAEREGALSDITANSIGAMLGVLCYRFWGKRTLTYVDQLISDVKPYLTHKVLISGYIIYLLSSVLVILWLQQTTDLHNWNASFHLAVGNEITGDRPWQGTISTLMIVDRALSRTEVAAMMLSRRLPTPAAGSVMGIYQFKEGDSYPDLRGILPDLQWRSNEPAVQVLASGVTLGNGFWLSTHEPVTPLTQAIAQASQFTLSAVITSASPDQFGPARIITISHDPFQRNLTVGQEGNDLILRIRTGFSRNNGALPELVIPGVVADNDSHDLVITYDGKTARVYLDAQHSYELTFTPAIIAFSYLLPTDSWIIRISGPHLWIYRLLYSTLIFMPLGLLLSLIELRLSGKLIAFWLIKATTIIATAALLAIVAEHGNSDVSDTILSVLLGGALMVGTTLLVRQWTVVL